ncbi:uncharacterized protein KY384_008364 [Bacidia gigantensis]|uniref:uncharacterized protein n=1 Tax=Bacidia gigantensis TaxID=2732470 RepID=UPI001D04D127|nr:uncharacterized protein KY384_008364 [Bacidia gigantensis]KAG8526935.1 hypothetical protein KY384_008364 [Bacidia gigantensis]
MSSSRPKTATGRWNWSRFAGAHGTNSEYTSSEDGDPLPNMKHPLVPAEEEQLPRKPSIVDHTSGDRRPSGEQSCPRKTVTIHDDPTSDEQQPSDPARDGSAQRSLGTRAIASESLEHSLDETNQEPARRDSRFLELTDERQTIPTISLELITDPTKATQEPDRPEVPPMVPVIKIQRPSREPSGDAIEASPNDLCTCPSSDVPDTYVTDINAPASDQVRSDVAQALEIAEEHDTELVAVMPKSTNTGTNLSMKPVRIKKHKMALRKSRNAIARKTFLKAGLGRQLAMPTKDALRRLARGEDVTIADIKVIG